ncbi:MAG: enoyl-CoA hydratase-related protein [Casimicrobiaceae bacterium]|nr:enoyl-CoA hydratase-related protein [Casimicrobiaceae bacterium]MCX8099476.1 enoyl-CoA hydratase-related protein [Casimicrobiaceae bacterium]MDW8312495.1 enoyl-CoA hydratase-related protein [Burkholderiales bacterium]
MNPLAGFEHDVHAPVLLLEHEGEERILTLRLNRPQAMNTLDHAMTEAFVDAVRFVLADPRRRVLILEGAGEHFMAGGDLKDFARTLDQPGEERREHFRAMIHRLHAAIELLQRAPLITIAKVRGACAGFGLSLAIGCDLTLASEEAYFTTAYASIGLTPDGGQSYFLPRMVGLKRAFELLLLSERISATEALSLGLLTRVVAADALDATTEAIARRLAHGSRHAMAGAKRLLSTSMSKTMSEQLAAEAESFAHCAAQEDFAEGVRAFLEKRGTRFT